MVDGSTLLSPGESNTTPTPVGRNKVMQLQQRLATGALPDDEEDTVPLIFQTGGLFRNPLFDKLVAKSRFMRRELQQLYRIFKTRCPAGHVDKATFGEVYAQLLGSSVDHVRDYAELVFNAFARDGEGTISFMEYITMLSICRRGDSREKLLCVFRIYDSDGDGLLNQDETHQLASSIYNLTLYKDSAVPAPSAAVDELAKLLFDRMDERKAGRVTAAEFLRACEKDETIGNIVRLTLKTPASAYDASEIHHPQAPDAAPEALAAVEAVPAEPKKSSLEVYIEQKKAREDANPKMLQFKRPPIVRKVKRKKAHPYSERHCPSCPDQHCFENFEPNVFKANVCKWCAHTHTLKEHEPPEQEPAAMGSQVSNGAGPTSTDPNTGAASEGDRNSMSFAMAASLAGISPEVLASLPAHVLQSAMDEAANAMAASPPPLPQIDGPLPALHARTDGSVKQRQPSIGRPANAPAYAAAPSASPVDGDTPDFDEAMAGPISLRASVVAFAAVPPSLTADEAQALEAALAEDLSDSLEASQASGQWNNAHNLLREEAERMAREEAERVALEELRALSAKAEQGQGQGQGGQEVGSRTSLLAKDKDRIRSQIVVGDGSLPAALSPAGADLEGWRAEAGDEPPPPELAALSSDRSNDAAILLAMAKTNPLAYHEQRQRASTLTKLPSAVKGSPPKMAAINEGEDEEILRIANESGLFTMDGVDYTLSLVENNLTEMDEEKDPQGRRFHMDRTGMRVYRAADVVAAHRAQRHKRGSKACASQ